MSPVPSRSRRSRKRCRYRGSPVDNEGSERIAELESWGAGELGTGSWRAGELGNWGTGELGSWRAEHRSWEPVGPKLEAGSRQLEADDWNRTGTKLDAGSW